MFAVGRITEQTSATGHPMVELSVDGRTSLWCLSNPMDIPLGTLDYGLFQFEPQDQFCRWVDPDTLAPQEAQP